MQIKNAGNCNVEALRAVKSLRSKEFNLNACEFQKHHLLVVLLVPPVRVRGGFIRGEAPEQNETSSQGLFMDRNPVELAALQIAAS